MGPASYAKMVIAFVMPQGDFYMFCVGSFSLVKLAPLLSGAPLVFFVYLHDFRRRWKIRLATHLGAFVNWSKSPMAVIKVYDHFKIALSRANSISSNS